MTVAKPFCPSCGSKLAASHRFCPKCGTARVTETPDRSSAAKTSAAPPSGAPTTPPVRSGPRATTGVVLLLAGGAGIVLGIIGLLVADNYKPTIENALAGGEVLSRESYNTLRALAWIFILGGGIVAGVGFLQLNGSLVVQRVRGSSGASALATPPPRSKPPPKKPAATKKPRATKPKPAPIRVNLKCAKCGTRFRRSDVHCGSCGAPRPKAA